VYYNTQIKNSTNIKLDFSYTRKFAIFTAICDRSRLWSDLEHTYSTTDPDGICSEYHCSKFLPLYLLKCFKSLDIISFSYFSIDR
jgi:hypothetical protein